VALRPRLSPGVPLSRDGPVRPTAQYDGCQALAQGTGGATGTGAGSSNPESSPFPSWPAVLLPQQ
jgi:hypothetical protein